MFERKLKYHKKRFPRLLNSMLSRNNLFFQNISTAVIPVISYIAGLVNWTLGELRQLKRVTIKQLTIYEASHPKGDYLCPATKEGG